MKGNRIKLAYFTDHSIEEIVDAHIEYVTRPRCEYDDENCYFEELTNQDRANGLMFPKWHLSLKVVEEGGKAPRKAILIHKYKFLVNEIISLCKISKSNRIHLNYAEHVNVLGKEYGKMLHNLDMMRIIDLSNVYEVGKKSRAISLLDWNIGYEESIDKKVLEYAKELGKYCLKREKEKKKDICNTLGSDFVNTYNRNLSQIVLTSKDDAVAYITGRDYDSPASMHFYFSCIENFNSKNNKIVSVDDRGRIYHFLTNTPRVLRRFFNLKYDIDIRNSQPLLFSKFLIEKYNIHYSLIDFICNIDNKLLVNGNNSVNNNDNNGGGIYYKGKQLRKLLKNSDIPKVFYKDIPVDVLLYIYSTMKGIFWDDFIDTFKELDRGEVKANLFREVFYSYARTMRYKEYGKAFAKVYPTVWRIIREMKTDAELLCNRITKVESELFHSILRQCFERDWVVVSIHDAVVVLDVEANDGLDDEELKNIILNEYSKHLLRPTLSVETFR